MTGLRLQLIQFPHAATNHPVSARSAARSDNTPRPATVKDRAAEDRVRLRTRSSEECDCGQGTGEIGARTRDIDPGSYPGHYAGPRYPDLCARGTEGGWNRGRDDEAGPGKTRRFAGCGPGDLIRAGPICSRGTNGEGRGLGRDARREREFPRRSRLYREAAADAAGRDCASEALKGF